MRGSVLAGSEELESATRWRLLGRRRGDSLGRDDLLSEGEDVLGNLAVPVADHEGNAAVDGQHEGPAVGDDRVRDLAAEAGFDVRCLDPPGAVVAVRDKLNF